jgi:hypothetical protein
MQTPLGPPLIIILYKYFVDLSPCFSCSFPSLTNHKLLMLQLLYTWPYHLSDPHFNNFLYKKSKSHQLTSNLLIYLVNFSTNHFSTLNRLLHFDSSKHYYHNDKILLPRRIFQKTIYFQYWITL